MKIREYIFSFPKRVLNEYIKDRDITGWYNLLSCETEEQVYNLLAPYMDLKDMEQDD